MKTQFLSACYPQLEKELLQQMEEAANLKQFSAGTYIVKQGQYIRFLPIIVSGTVKVYSMEDTIQFLLYYISAGDACIHSFAHIIRNDAAAFSAIAESDSELLLLPIDHVNRWLKQYPSFNTLVLADFQKHYQNLLHTTKQIICYNLEERLVQYLRSKAELSASDLLKISHQEIASDLGTSREVISRLMKKLGAQKIVKQEGRQIRIL